MSDREILERVKAAVEFEVADGFGNYMTNIQQALSGGED